MRRFAWTCLEEALRPHGKPEIFNSDQGAQFTSHAFTGVLKREKIAISMDGRGRARGNIFVERLWRSVKHKDVYLKGYATMGELTLGLTRYFAFYDDERPHQSLDNRTPDEVYASRQGGSARIVDKFGAAREASPVPLLWPCRTLNSNAPARRRSARCCSRTGRPSCETRAAYAC